MGYGQGDYGQGDYGQGDDEGDIFGFFKKIVHGVSGVINRVTGALSHHGNHLAASSAGGGSIAFTGQQPVERAGPTSTDTNIGYGLFHRQVNVGASSSAGAAPGMPGYHQIKRGRNAGKWVRNRHMNITNPRALRRAIRRGHGFEKMARRMLGFATPHKPKGRMYFKKATTRKR